MERLMLVFCLIISLQIHSAIGDGGVLQDDPKTLGNPPPSKLIADTISILKRSHEIYWGKIRTFFHEMQSQSHPPNLDFRGSEESKPIGDGGGLQDDPKTLGNPPPSKIIADTISILKRSHESYWGKIKTFFHEMQSQSHPPNLDFRGSEESKPEIENGAGGKMKAAAEKTFGSCKETVEESAKSAVEVVGYAVHKTADVVKEGMTGKEHHHDEL